MIDDWWLDGQPALRDARVTGVHRSQVAVFARNRERVNFDMVIEPTSLPEAMEFVE